VEFYAHQRNFRSCIFRLSTVYAPPSEGNTPNFVSHYADAINNGESLRLPAGGTPRRDLLHVDDFARACQSFIDSALGHGLYNLGGGFRHSLTLRQLVEKLEEVSGLQAVVDPDSSGTTPPVPLNYVTDLSHIQQELDWDPKIDLKDGLKTLFV
jgi:nucleoside-diphosphate-sugar epimerase